MNTRHGIIAGVDCYPANQRESDIILEHLKRQPCKYQEIGLDGGYDIGAVHRGLELLEIRDLTSYGLSNAEKYMALAFECGLAS